MRSEFPSQEDWATVIESPDGAISLYSRKIFRPGDILTGFKITDFFREPTRHSIQHGDSEHFLIAPDCLQFMNHSCDPNVAIHMKDKSVRSIRPIQPGDEIVYFYPSTEWSMVEPFRCTCNSQRCLAYVRGAAYLPLDLLAGYRLSDHILKLLAKREEAITPGALRKSRKAARQLNTGEALFVP